MYMYTYMYMYMYTYMYMYMYIYMFMYMCIYIYMEHKERNVAGIWEHKLNEDDLNYLSYIMLYLWWVLLHY